MKATFPLTALKEAVAKACSVVPSRTTKDILKNVLIAASGDQATVSATDCETSIVTHVRGIECSHHGRVLLPAAKLSQILSEVNGDVLTMDEDDRKVTIRCGRAKFTITTDDPDNFPPVTEFSEIQFLRVPGLAFKKMLDRTLFCCADADKNPAFTGLCLLLLDGKLHCATSDRNRISAAVCDATTEGGFEFPADKPLAQKSSMQSLKRVIGDGPLDISVESNRLVFRSGDSTFACMRLNVPGSKFPDWLAAAKRFAPKHTIDLMPNTFSSALRQASITTAEDSLRIDFQFSAGSLSLRGSAADVGESTVEIPVPFDGEASLMLNHRYVLEAVKQMDQSVPFSFGVFFKDEEDGGSLVARTSDGFVYHQMGLSLV